MRAFKPSCTMIVFVLMILITTLFFQVHLAFSDDKGVVIKITAKKFEYSPKDISVKKGVPVTLEFVSLDRLHGFYCAGLKIRTDIEPNKVNKLRFIPEKAGTYPFHCDNFCGGGHEGMTGTITVTE
ncbi:MAG: Nitrous-oxide reductase [Syntrophus sp. SKADARSKE-3]|nr:Nitrous-oxide reductase [Syntrophus sp. SKADARSKE-3]